MYRKIPPFLVFAQIFYLHFISQFLFTIHYDFYGKIFFTISYNLTAFLTYVYFFMTLNKKGFVDCEEHKNHLLVNHMKFTKHCNKCNSYRPERSHHCSKCDGCIKKMDHHCYWLNVCINNDNLAHFVRFMFWGALGALEAIVCFSYVSIDVYGKQNSDVWGHLWFFMAVVTVINAICMLIGLVLFLISTIKYILKNLTYLEGEICKNFTRLGYELNKNPYDKGKYENFKEVMGKPKFLFMFGETGEGLQFGKTYNTGFWPPAKSEIERIKMDRRAVHMIEQ